MTEPTEERPLVTFALFAYNQEQFIREAVEGALAQTYSPLEIILSDDCSQDSTFKIISRIAEEYKGPHKLVWRQNEANLGLIGHINKVMKVASGELIVAAAGDDISYPSRVNRLVDQWIKNGKRSGSILSGFKTIDSTGNIASPPLKQQVKIYCLIDRHVKSLHALAVGTSGCTHAWTRDAFDVFGSIDDRVIHEDITIPLRSILLGSVTFMPDQLVLYRIITGTQSRIAFAGYRERFKKMAWYWEGRVANYEQFAVDATRAINLKPTIAKDVKWLNENVISSEAELARVNYRFFSGGFIDRILSIFISSRKVPVSRKLKLLILLFFPWAYGIKSR